MGIPFHTKTADKIALVIACIYAVLVAQAQLGAMIGSVSLDPVWAALQRRGTLRVATDIGWRPFADEQGGQIVGYDIDLTREIARRLGLRVEFVPLAMIACMMPLQATGLTWWHRRCHTLPSKVSGPASRISILMPGRCW